MPLVVKKCKSGSKSYLPGVVVALALLVISAKFLHSFLSINRPVKSTVIIVEGWVFDYMVDTAVSEILNNDYQYVLTTGPGKLGGDQPAHRGAETVAENCRARLIAKGVAPHKIHAVDAGPAQSHRTFHAARAAREWLIRHNVRAVNIFTGGPHGRKTYEIYDRVLGPSFKVGIISCDIEHYDPHKWWLSINGISVTLRYLAGYIYALTWPFELWPPA